MKGLINCMCIPLLGAETTTQDPNPYKGGLPILTWIKNFSEWWRGGVIYLQIFSTGIQPRGLDEALSYVVLTILYGKSKGGFVPTPLSATSIKNLPFSSKSSGRQPWQLMLMLAWEERILYFQQTTIQIFTNQVHTSDWAWRSLDFLKMATQLLKFIFTSLKKTLMCQNDHKNESYSMK